LPKTLLKAALVQMSLKGLLVVTPPAHIAEDPQDAGQHDEVDRSDQVEEHAGHAGANDRGDLVQAGRTVAHRTREGPDAEGQQQRQDEHHGRMAE